MASASSDRLLSLVCRAAGAVLVADRAAPSVTIGWSSA